MALSTLRVFIPVSRLAGKADDDLIGPTVAVDIVGPTEHTFAIAFEAVAIVTDLANLMDLPVRGFIPNVPAEDIHFSVFVDVGDGDPFGAELLVDDGLLPGNRRRLVETYIVTTIRPSPFQTHQQEG